MEIYKTMLCIESDNTLIDKALYHSSIESIYKYIIIYDIEPFGFYLYLYAGKHYRWLTMEIVFAKKQFTFSSTSACLWRS